MFDEEEEEGIDLRQALALIYQRDLLPVPATSQEQRSFTPGTCYRPVTRTGSKGFFWRASKLQPTFTPGWASHPGVKVGCSFVSRMF